MKKLLQKISRTLAIAVFGVAVFVPAAVSAADIQGGLCAGAGLEVSSINTPGGECSSEDQTQTVNDTITFVINLFSILVGVVAVIMIIFGGFRYITSGGDSGKVTGAKNTILYAIIGLVLVALAQVIVKFVLGKASGLDA